MSDMVKKGCAGVGALGLFIVVGVVATLVSMFMNLDVAGDDQVRGPTSVPITTTEPRDDAPRPNDGPSPSAPDTKGDAPSSRKGGSIAYPNTPVARRGNVKIESFSSSKRNLMKIHADRPRTFYCGCGFEPSKSIDLRECKYEIRSNKSRASRVEFEHVVPASAFGHQIDAWTKGHPKCTSSNGKKYKGRRCAERASSEFELMQADMHNLQPAVGEVNADRLNYVMAELDGEVREYGVCDVEIRDKKIEPRPEVRGDIARTYLYMDWAYPKYHLIPDAKQRAMFERWAKDDPVDSWERKRARRVADVQGNVNPFVE